MPNYKKTNYRQNAMVVVNFEEQIQPGTFEHTLHTLIDNYIDLSAFHDNYKNDHGGRSAYHPAILLKIILFAYSKGITSSREIQWQCEHNIVFKALACDSVPHFTGIASFVSSYPAAIESVFEQVLLVCDQQGLIGNELFAIDGCKLPSNASKEHSGTFTELETKRSNIKRKIRECIQEHRTLDGRKPDENRRKRQLEKQADTLQKHFEKIDQFLKTAAPRMGQGKKPTEVKSNITDNESAKMTTGKGTIQGYNGVETVDRKHQIPVDAQAFGEGQEQHTLAPVVENIQRLYNRTGMHKDIMQSGVIVTADTGFSNDANNQWLREKGINAWIPDPQFRQRDKAFKNQKEKYGKRHQGKTKGIKSVIPASEFSFNRKNKTCHCPRGNEMWLHHESRKDGKHTLMFEGKLTDCRQCDIKEDCMRNPSAADTREGHGRQVSITWTTSKNATHWMRKRVDSRKGKEIYSHRMSVVEPVFANMCSNKGLKRFSLRSKSKVEGQWKLYCMVHNIEKLANYGKVA